MKLLKKDPQLQEERGASMVEYALLVTLIALVAFIAVAFAGDELSQTYSTIGETMQSVN